MAPNYRKKFIVNARFQYTFIAVMVIVSLASIACFYVANWQFFDSFQSISVQFSMPESHPYRQFIMNQQKLLNKFFIIASVVNFVFITIIGMLWSNKIAGPIYRIQQSLRRIADGGKIDNITVRKDDFFQELPESINEVFAKIREKR